MEFQSTIDHVLGEGYEEVGAIRGIEDSWELYETDTGYYIDVVTHEGLQFLRDKGVQLIERAR